MRRALNRARRLAMRLRGLVAARPRGAGTPLTVVREEDVLPRVADVLTEAPADGPGAVAELFGEVRLGDDETRARLGQGSGGVDVPGWADGADGVVRARVDLARTRDVWHAPALGAVFDAQGRVFDKPVQEALYLTPTLRLVPGVTIEDDRPVFRAPRRVPVLERATVFAAWGGLHNYGHFLLDCLPALVAADLAGGLERYPAIAPSLAPWHHDLLSLMMPAGFAPRTMAAPLLRIEDALFASPMGHFLHQPNAPLDQVRARILAAVGAEGASGPRKIYISRLGAQKRTLTNEAELEAALSARGFAIIRPETLSVREQVALFQQAQIVVGAAGAGLANVLFCPPGATVIEIQPSNFTGLWVRNIALLVGLDWRGFFAPSPLSETEIFLEGVRRPAAEFVWRLDLEAFLVFLDDRA